MASDSECSGGHHVGELVPVLPWISSVVPTPTSSSLVMYKGPFSLNSLLPLPLSLALQPVHALARREQRLRTWHALEHVRAHQASLLCDPVVPPSHRGLLYLGASGEGGPCRPRHGPYSVPARCCPCLPSLPRPPQPSNF